MTSVIEKDSSFISNLTQLMNEGKSYHEIERCLGISRPTVSKYAKIHGLHKEGRIKLKKHTLDLEYFKSINTPDKAYVLGLLYADGCNTRKGLHIALQEEDKASVMFIKTQLNASNSLRFIPKAKPTWSNKWELSIKSVELSNQLTDVGIHPAKSLTLLFPALKEEYISHFIRGYFDGDGGINKTSAWRISLTSGSKPFIEALTEVLLKQGISIKTYSAGKNKTCYALQTSKRSEIARFLRYIYRDCTFSMKRKHDKAVLFFKEEGGMF